MRSKAKKTRSSFTRAKILIRKDAHLCAILRIAVCFTATGVIIGFSNKRRSDSESCQGEIFKSSPCALTHCLRQRLFGAGTLDHKIRKSGVQKEGGFSQRNAWSQMKNDEAACRAALGDCKSPLSAPLENLAISPGLMCSLCSQDEVDNGDGIFQRV